MGLIGHAMTAGDLMDIKKQHGAGKCVPVAESDKLSRLMDECDLWAKAKGSGRTDVCADDNCKTFSASVWGDKHELAEGKTRLEAVKNLLEKLKSEVK